MNTKRKSCCSVVPLFLLASPVVAADTGMGLVMWSIVLVAFVIALLILWLAIQTKNVIRSYLTGKSEPSQPYENYLTNLQSDEIQVLLDMQRKSDAVKRPGQMAAVLFASGLLAPFTAQAQATGSLLSQEGILITIFLLVIPMVIGVFILAVKIKSRLNQLKNRHQAAQARQLAGFVKRMPLAASIPELLTRKQALDFRLTNQELAGNEPPSDAKGLIGNVQVEVNPPFVARKKKAIQRPKIDPELARLINWFIGCAGFWLLLGTTVGEYLGIKFVAPDVDGVSWLSFGRLRPVHTNSVFWGWASLAMLGLGHYVVPRVSNTSLYSIRLGWYSLILINVAVLTGTLFLMGGINNGGGEYREYIWPVMLSFSIGLFLTLLNFFQTVGTRTTTEIYISNWYIISAILFGITIVLVAYLPFWQNGLGETIIQGYYMHQGVGMWFMLFTLGIVYYFLPQQLNRPIYSYSLGILAFWAQILFYTLIGTHHFVFSAIPWWLQTLAIVGSVGMVIPVVAGTTNFLMTFRGSWHKLADSYTLPFFLTGVVFYFTGSLQGTAEAFRFTNLVWHFTDFTVAHSHLTMYGIISFLLWASIYALVPRLTGQEPPQITVGVHFWLALLGLLFYTVPLMYGSTLRGLMWMEGKPFIESVVLMAPYWLWRAIGGSLMWLSHVFFAYNLYRMLRIDTTFSVRDAAFDQLKAEYSDAESTR
ncbi:cbb3-type cytochrome c oxidase subunit I [Larkinella terrae]|uniref:Cytochrome oxidase subunit I n=1 Tax=Larkinella terrae TaxID=2025311 RepID=A0A7K0EFK6_9BACT|nr:cbb3-type cytochrome c oxidase subunit I [Larkinella terrae]MRS60228.1 cytochrome oxidase subunit I [Larkinella terrae]